MDVWAAEERHHRADLILDGASPDLDIQDEQESSALGPFGHLLNHSGVHPQPILPIRTGTGLGDDGHQLQCELHGMRGIGGRVRRALLFEARDHLLRRQLAEDPHRLGQRVAVVAQDPVLWQDRADKGVVAGGIDGGPATGPPSADSQEKRSPLGRRWRPSGPTSQVSLPSVKAARPSDGRHTNSPRVVRWWMPPSSAVRAPSMHMPTRFGSI